ncbi:acetylglutamate kinase [Thermanaerovibrio velox DSM 12556]|uniref:Acetylglutamate kinase n=2 Tax=Thermanaerovibrio TaxID=81461 RepID=H0UNR4_9BACT|nr:acetylglutamate kinase [Thermanaerovibrio velox DSM 12556]
MCVFGVVKIGGASGNRLEPLLEELACRFRSGERWVLVHGASGMMERLCAERGVEVRHVVSPSGYRSRFVGPLERCVFEEAAFAVSRSIAERMEALGVSCQVLTPAEGERKDCLRSLEGGRVRILRGNYSGRVAEVREDLILSALEQGKLPLLPPLAACDGVLINVDGDRLAAAAASTLEASVMVMLTNTPGLLLDPSDPSSLISRVGLDEWDAADAAAQGNMKRKVLAAREALMGGVQRVVIGDGRLQNPIGRALGGGGTVFCSTRSAQCMETAASR